MPQKHLLTGLICLALSVRSLAQPDTSILVSPDLKEVTLDSCLKYIRYVAGFKAIYSSSLTRDLKPITYRQQNVPLNKMLDTVLGKLGLGYTFSKEFIRLYHDEELFRRYNKPDTLTGKVTSESGEPLGGVSVHDVKAGRYAITSFEGVFKLPWLSDSGWVEFTHVAYEKRVVRVQNTHAPLQITLKPVFGATEEVVIMAYHNVSRRNNTAAAYRLQGIDVSRGSINHMRELSGKVPGLVITEANGAPGAAVRVQIRGRQSIGIESGVDNQPLNDPLILLDKIPLVTGNKPVTLLPSAAGDPAGGGISGGGISAQAAINPENIETIDILKDADATAIYGSRGAHGAILITTKTGKAGKPAFRFNLQSGAVTSSYVPQLLDNKQYTAMRKEAIKAAGLQPTVNNASDLFRLDTNNYINVPQLLAGGTGRLTNINVSLQGGNSSWRYYGSAGYYHESSVMPRRLPQQRFSSHANIRYHAPNRRLQANLSLLYSALSYNSLASDPLLYSARVVPLLPSLHDANGNLVWAHNGFAFMNPLGQFENSSNTRIQSFSGGLQAGYQLAKGLFLRSTFGYQSLPVKEELILRMAAGYPDANTSTANNKFQSFIVEPRLEYDHPGKGDWQWGGLLGATFQEERNNWTVVQNMGYTSDSLIGTPGNWPTLTGWSDNTYRYRAAYGRWHTDWRNRYFFNATGRLDISSRLGPRRKGGVFWALGGAWIFSEEKWFRSFKWLTHGKLRSSYGTTGNDNYDDYAYLETWAWQSGQQAYDSVKQVHRIRQDNPLLGWEMNRKLELALDLEAFQSLSLNVAWYRNITADQLVTRKIPGQPDSAGYAIVNWPARVLNTGWEFTLRTVIGQGKKMSYTSTLVLTLPRNRLLAFPELDSSMYATSLMIGQPLSVQRGYPYSGVDPTTGLFTIPPKLDTTVTGHWEPQACLGWSQEWRLGRFRVSLFLEARQLKSLHPLYSYYSNGSAPGRWNAATQQSNQPRTVWQRWQQQGDEALLQRFTVANTQAVQMATAYFRQSSMMMADASFWRIRSVYLGYDLPGSCHARVYLQGQNLFTGTAFRDGDPSLQYPGRLSLSAQRVITAGVQVSF